MCNQKKITAENKKVVFEFLANLSLIILMSLTFLKKCGKTSQKKVKQCYMVSGSLCLTSFINVESHFSLVVIGQWPRRGK